MLSNPFSSDRTVWRRTIMDLRNRFQEAAERFSSVRYVVLQALDTPGAIPMRFQQMFRKAGGYEVREIKPRWEPQPNGFSQGLDPDFTGLVKKCLAWDCAAKLGYLSGPEKGRRRFATLAEQAWLALPGTRAGKDQKNSQLTATERWWKVVQENLLRNPGTYFQAYDRLLAEYRAPDGKRREEEFEAEQVKQGDFIGVGYPNAENLPVGAERWLVTELATDPFSASAVAIDLLLADPDPEGQVVISLQEMQTWTESPAFRNANHRLDILLLGGNRAFDIYRCDCKAVEGCEPTICPSADRPRGKQDREAFLHFLPKIEEVYRKHGFIKDGQTIHWVGGQTSLGTVCKCTQAELDRIPRIPKEIGNLLHAATPATSARSRTTVPGEEAKILIRQYLAKHPKATVREIHDATGVSTGAISQSAPWKAHDKEVPGRSGANQSLKTIQLTQKMLEAIGRIHDPKKEITTREAAWEYLIENASNEAEEARLRHMPPNDRKKWIDQVIGQFSALTPSLDVHEPGA